jgi:hypothetical protein
MRQPASAPYPVGTLVVVVVEAQPTKGVWRVERVIDDEHRRCFSYADGSIAVWPVSSLQPCPPGTRAG